jgi:hypothetical protein
VEVEAIKPRRKINTRQSVAEAINIKALPKINAHVLPEICNICGRDASWFPLDKVWYFDRYNTSAMCTTFAGLDLKYIEL